MKQIFSRALAAGVALAVPLAASAVPPAQSAAGPQEAQAAVPAATYRSAFDGYRPAAEDEATPDQTWRALNQKVGDAGGHMGMMQMPGHKMDGHKMGGHSMPMQKMPMDHATPKPDAKPDAKPAPQHRHEGH